MIDKQAPPLSLFEDVFEPLISQSRNIVIQYQLQFECSHDVCINNMMKCSVNGCCSPDDFFKKLSEMVDSSVRAMFEALKCSHFSYWQSYIAYVQNKLQDLETVLILFFNSVKHKSDHCQLNHGFTCIR